MKAQQAKFWDSARYRTVTVQNPRRYISRTVCALSARYRWPLLVLAAVLVTECIIFFSANHTLAPDATTSAPIQVLAENSAVSREYAAQSSSAGVHVGPITTAIASKS